MKKVCFISFLQLLSFGLLAQLTINVTMVPDNTPLADPLYVAGNFNNWDAGNGNYVLSSAGNGNYNITINPNPGLLEFKFTRGSWPTVEGNENGGFLPNRQYNYNGSPTTINLTILSWEDLGGSSGNSTAADNVLALDDNFNIPQLNRERKIWIYLPPDYDTSNKDYPVLYMQDGQNLFDAFLSFSGEWEVDESLNDLFSQGDDGIIVVGIENGGAHRINEYSPWVNPQYGGGEGAQYVDFIVNTLKPFVDNNYRTKSDRDHTGIMGSSMGGLISMYAAIEHQEVFSKAGIFSPSFWFSDEAYQHVTNTGKEADMRIYLLAGEQESASMVPDLQQMYTWLLNAGFGTSEVQIITHGDGQHSEWYWNREFPDAYEWLCPDITTNVNQHHNPFQISIFPNPADKIFYIHTGTFIPWAAYQLLTLDGRILLERNIQSEYSYVDVSALNDSLYILNILSEGKVVHSKKVIVR